MQYNTEPTIPVYVGGERVGESDTFQYTKRANAEPIFAGPLTASQQNVRVGEQVALRTNPTYEFGVNTELYIEPDDTVTVAVPVDGNWRLLTFRDIAEVTVAGGRTECTSFTMQMDIQQEFDGELPPDLASGTRNSTDESVTIHTSDPGTAVDVPSDESDGFEAILHEYDST
jgi:hypothetical protein